MEDKNKTTPPPDWRLNNKNPHLAQAYIVGKTHLPESKEEFCRIMKPNSLSEKYRRRSGELKSVIHWGQRKLLMHEIEFLTKYSYPGCLVVYAGAAPGTHIRYLSYLFPDVNFVLIDPCDFNIRPSNRIQIRQEFFTHKMAESYSGQEVLFICDIRTANPLKMNGDEVEKRIKQDMKWQSDWHKIMQSRRSLLKFRLPWEKGITNYLDGDVMYPVWGGRTTSESRLIPFVPCIERDWDNMKYCDQMFRFNTVSRQQCYQHNVLHTAGLDHCYDCCAEIYILCGYLIWKQKHPDRTRNRSRNGSPSPSSDPPLIKTIISMSRIISYKLSGGKRLLSHPPEHRNFNRTSKLQLESNLPKID